MEVHLRIRNASVVVDASSSVLVASVFDLITLVSPRNIPSHDKEDQHSLSR